MGHTVYNDGDLTPKEVKHHGENGLHHGLAVKALFICDRFGILRKEVIDAQALQETAVGRW